MEPFVGGTRTGALDPPNYSLYLDARDWFFGRKAPYLAEVSVLLGYFLCRYGALRDHIGAAYPEVFANPAATFQDQTLYLPIRA